MSPRDSSVPKLSAVPPSVERPPCDAPVSIRLCDATVDELARRASAGDVTAMGLLYDRLAEPIHRYVAVRLRHQHDAEDVTQLIFERVVAALPRYRDSGRPFQAWVFRIARNAVVDHQRRIRRVEPLFIAEDQRDGVAPDALAERGEEIRELRRAIERLTADQREALSLRFVAGLSADEAASVMGRQAGTIRGLTFRAIASLRRLMVEPGRA